MNKQAIERIHELCDLVVEVEALDHAPNRGALRRRDEILQRASDIRREADAPEPAGCWGRLPNGEVLAFNVCAPLVGLRFTEVHLQIPPERLDRNTLEWIGRVVWTKRADARNHPFTVEIR